jgi:uncharacterized protein YozE (UPF0346 family)
MPLPERARPSLVKTYIISDGGTLVKIGKARNPHLRLRGLQTGSARSLALLLILEGDREYDLHERFKEHRVHGEWFTLNEDIRAFIAQETGKVWRGSFFKWLCGQHHRSGRVGQLARHALEDKTFPRNGQRLHVFLHQYTHDARMRACIKIAHREWRRLHHHHKV